jgi:hypothetical protein
VPTRDVDLELMPGDLPHVRGHPTVERVRVVGLGRPHIAGVVGETAGTTDAEAHFFDDELMLSAQQHPHRFLAAVSSENDQFAVGLGGAGDRSVDRLGLPVEYDSRHLGWSAVGRTAEQRHQEKRTTGSKHGPIRATEADRAHGHSMCARQSAWARRQPIKIETPPDPMGRGVSPYYLI